MNVYLLRADANRYTGIIPTNNDDWDVFQRFDGSRLIESWSPLKVSYDVEDSRALAESDFPTLATHVPVFSQRAVDFLGGLLTKNGELLPLDCQGVKYFAYNVTNLVDALDLHQSEIVRFSTGRILDITRYAFHSARLPHSNGCIFKLKQTPLMDVFVNEHFTAVVEKNCLTGFTLKQVWHS